ncbi:MAG: UbiX family flavin prenyltransferase [Anaerolineales bacterium]|nr:UbiX family flavin prenyltransferase [Anaerolineales bacterium]
MRIVVGMTGASGAAIAARLLQELVQHQVHLVITKAARSTISLELGSGVILPATFEYDAQDLGAPIASSSFLIDAVVIVPCTVKTLASIAQGYTENLVVRAADIALRMRRKLVLVPRETPLSLPTIENMRTAALAGAIILPPMMGYYFAPQSVEEVTDFFTGKILDILGVDHGLYRRWNGFPKTQEKADS